MMFVADMESIFDLGRDKIDDSNVKFVFEDDKKSYTLDELLKMRAEYAAKKARLGQQILALNKGTTFSHVELEDYQEYLVNLERESVAFEHMKWKPVE